MKKKKLKNCPPGCEFIFRTPEGNEVGRASNREEFIKMLRAAPISSLLFHARGNHFAPWLQFIGEEEAAKKIQALKIDEQTIRVHLLRCMR